jgi:hypothetical protein
MIKGLERIKGSWEKNGFRSKMQEKGKLLVPSQHTHYSLSEMVIVIAHITSVCVIINQEYTCYCGFE